MAAILRWVLGKRDTAVGRDFGSLTKMTTLEAI